MILSLAAFLLLIVGAVHSVTGEYYLLTHLCHRTDLPKLFGSAATTARTLRLVWHATTLAWWGLAVLLFHLARGPVAPQDLTEVIGLTLGATGLLTLALTRGRNFAWPVFLLLACLALAHAMGG